MSKKNKPSHSQIWYTEGEQMPSPIIKSLIYYNDSVNNFLDLSDIKFIVGGKGTGKTMLLKQKRLNLENKTNSGHFIPSGRPYLDYPNEYVLRNINKEIIGILRSQKICKQLWHFSIMASVLSYDFNRSEHFNIDEIEHFPDWIKGFLTAKRSKNPSEILCDIINNTKLSFSQILSDVNGYFHHLESVFSNAINYSVYVFIDRLDQALMDTDMKYWISMQIGLLEACWAVNRKNNHINVYCSVRQEAYNNYTSPDLRTISGMVVIIKYSQEDLIQIAEKLSLFYSKKSLRELIGQTKFKHPKTKRFESVDDYLIRHTLGRPRDLIAIIKPWKVEGEFNLSNFRASINRSSSDLIGKNIFEEIDVFLDALRKREDRERFLSLVRHSVLDEKKIIEICSEFNKRSDCLQKGCRYSPACLHPFSELYNLGLLGVIDTQAIHPRGRVRQKFRVPEDIIVRSDDHNALPADVKYYLIHPCLFSYIGDLRPRHASNLPFVIPFLTLGNGLEWTNNDDNACKLFFSVRTKAEFDNLYNNKLFKMSIQERNKFIEDKCKRLKRNNASSLKHAKKTEGFVQEMELPFPKENNSNGRENLIEKIDEKIRKGKNNKSTVS